MDKFLVVETDGTVKGVAAENSLKYIRDRLQKDYGYREYRAHELFCNVFVLAPFLSVAKNEKRILVPERLVSYPQHSSFADKHIAVSGCFFFVKANRYGTPVPMTEKELDAVFEIMNYSGLMPDNQTENADNVQLEFRF